MTAFLVWLDLCTMRAGAWERAKKQRRAEQKTEIREEPEDRDYKNGDNTIRNPKLSRRLPGTT